jgi:hypothetical protein
MSKQVVVLVGTRNGGFLYQSDEWRNEWTCTGPHLDGREVSSLVGDSRGPDRLIAGVRDSVNGPGIRISDDLGKTWRDAAEGPRFPPETGFAVNSIWEIVPGARSEPDTFYAGVADAGLFVSRDRGLTWEELPGLREHPSRPAWTPCAGGLCVHSIVVDPDDPRRLWVAISDGGVFRTLDGGATWQNRGQGLPHGWPGDPEPDPLPDHDEKSAEKRTIRGVHKMAADPTDSNTLYVQHVQGVFRSRDGADSWDRIDFTLPNRFGFPIAVTRTGTLYIAPVDITTRCFEQGKLQLYRLKKNESQWQPVGNGLPAEPRQAGVLRDALAIDPLDPAGVYFGATQGEMFCSPDDGQNWRRLPGQLARITSVRTWIRDD